MLYLRNVFPSLLEHLAKRQVTVITGMRRTGKTTLLNQLMENSHIAQKVFFDLERIDNRELFSEKNYESLVHVLIQRGIQFSEKILIGIDEIQLVPNLPSVIKYLYDKYDIKFVVTGSSFYYMKNQFSESLAGRKKIFEIYPLSFNEFLTFKEVEYVTKGNFWERQFTPSEYERLKHHYTEYIDYGGFPDVVLTNKCEDKTDITRDILSSYINLDLSALTDIKKSTEVYKLIKVLAVRIGTRLEISKMSSLTGMTRSKVENYIDLLEHSYLIHTIPVTFTSPDREIVKARKIYFIDNGIASLSAELGSGAKFENTIFNQLQHFGDISYYSLKTGREIDFILNKKMAFEIKETARHAHLKKASTLAKNLSIRQVYVIGRYPNQIFPGFIWGGLIQ